MSVTPGLRGTDEPWTVEVLSGLSNSKNVTRVGKQREKHDYSMRRESFSWDNITFKQNRRGLNVSHTAIRLCLWRNTFLHAPSILPLLTSFKMHHHSTTHSPKAGMFTISFNTTRQRKARKSRNLMRSGEHVSKSLYNSVRSRCHTSEQRLAVLAHVKSFGLTSTLRLTGTIQYINSAT